MKFICYECQKETTFDINDYVGLGKKQQIETVIKLEIGFSLNPTLKTKKIIINCSNPDCRKPNKITIKYYE